MSDFDKRVSQAVAYVKGRLAADPSMSLIEDSCSSVQCDSAFGGAVELFTIDTDEHYDMYNALLEAFF